MASRALILAALLAAPSFPAAADGERPSLVWEDRDSGGELRICGLATDRLARLEPVSYREVLEVHAVDPALTPGAERELPPLWGSFAVQGDCLSFRPRHRPGSGMEIVAVFHGDVFDRRTGALRGTPSRELRVAAVAPERSTRVEEIFPSSEEAPANLLRLYVSFSGPMSLKGIEKHLRLLDGRGAEISTAFVDVPDGLWDPGRRRLTLILHPGRVKSGIALGDAMGKVLEEGAEVTLEIGEGARDAAGASLAAGGRRTWRVGPPQTEALDPGRFRLEVHEDSLEIAAPVSLDHALALSAFRVLRGGEELPGSWQLDPGERRLRFLPAKPWQRGEPHLLAIGSQLEDVAGNRLGRAFEAAADAPPAAAAAIPFVP